MTPRKAFKHLRFEKSDILRVIKYNEKEIAYYNNKPVLTGRESKDLAERKRVVKAYQNDLFHTEKNIDTLLLEFAYLQTAGYNINSIKS